MITAHKGGGVTIDGPESTSLYRMMVLKQALKLEMIGMKASRNVNAFKIAKTEFKLKGTKKEIFDAFCLLLEAAKAKHDEWQNQEIAKQNSPAN